MEKLIVLSSILVLTMISNANIQNYEPFKKSLELKSQQSIAEASKGKLQLVYFWATWCPDCKEKIKSDLSKYQNSNLDFVTLSIEDNKKKILKFVEENAVKPPVFFDPERSLQKSLKIFSVPTVVLGKIVDGKFVVLEQVSGKDWDKIDLAITRENKTVSN